MATTTPNFGWDIPQSTDLVKDGATAIAALGTDIDTSLVDLKGGTTGQILSKNSNTDMDFTWITNDVGDITAVNAGTGISGGGSSGAVTITNDMATTITASGDIIVGTGSGTYDNLPIGTTGQVLTADTTVSPYKVKWASSATSAPEYPTIAFNSYTHSGGTTQTASQTVSEDVTYYTAIWLPTCTVDRLSILSGGTWAGTSATVRLGLYNNGSSNLPTTVLLDAGTVTVTAATTTYEITVSQSVTAGLYWFAFNNQTNTSVTVNTYQGTSGVNRFFISRGAVTSSNYTGFEESGITGAFATAGTLSARSSATPTGYARLA